MSAAIAEQGLPEQLASLRRVAQDHKSAVRRHRRALQDAMESIRMLEARCRELGIGFEDVTGRPQCERP